MMKDSTGINGNVQFPADAMTLAKEINAGRIQIGVMQGHEFAWAKSKYADLVPIAVAAPLQPVQSFCVVKWDCTATNIGDLKNGKISLPPVHHDYSEMFLAKLKSECMNGANFAGQLNAADATEAIENVIDDKSQCTVVDAPTLNFFEKVYPGRFTCVKILCKSEVFPNACIVVKKGELDDKTIEKFTKALIDAKDDPVGKPMLSTWKLKSFTAVPAEYDAQLKAIEKAYPLPPTLRTAVDK
jgi:ABC-type phosphate/phosphonate transport system substrate-binding protein